MKPPVAVTIRSFDHNGPAFAQLCSHYNIVYLNQTGHRLSERELVSVISGVQGVIAGTESFSEEVLKSARDLRVISRIGVGTDNIDMSAAAQYGIKVLNTPTAPVAAVAEHTLGLILSVLKQIPEYNEAIRRGDYSIRTGKLLSGKKVGLIGLGRIGTAVAELLTALGCTIIFFDPFRNGAVPGSWQKAGSIESLLAASDIISLHAPPLPDGRPLLSDNEFNCCKKGIVIINTARGALIDETSLESALNTGTVSAAGLDVVSSEPYSGPLLNYPQVVITPHVASNTVESRQEMELEAVNNLINALEVCI